MESTVLSVGKSVLSGALGYASSAAAEEVALQLGIQRDHAFIRDELEMMQSFLMAADEERDDNMVVKTWVKQVRDVAYNVEDSLQDFAVHLEKLSWWRIPCTLLDRRHAAKEMKELRAQVEDVSHRNVRYRLVKGSGSKPATTAGQSSISSEVLLHIAEATRTALQANKKVNLVQLITEDESDLRLIAVWGASSDVGVTSIIRAAYQNQHVKEKFQCRAWVRLMHPFDPNDFFLSLVRQFYEDSCEETGKLTEGATIGVKVLKMMVAHDNLVDEFNRYVTEKRYLVVINDVSTIEEWDWIKTYFPSKKGSRIIMSTQQFEVASLCAEQPYTVSEIEQKWSFDKDFYVFYKKVDPPAKEDDKPEASSSEHAGEEHVKNHSHVSKMVAALEEDQLIDRVAAKAKVVQLIEQGGEVITICGMGGLGKTTLMRSVYQQELGERFERRAWFTMSRSFYHQEFLGELFRQLSKVYRHEKRKDDKPDTDKLQSKSGDSEDKSVKEKEPTAVIDKLAKILLEQKCLIVLDDLSSVVVWHWILQLLPKPRNIANRIIVTTRELNVAKHCSVEEINIYNLELLTETEALLLFKKKVFKDSKEKEDFDHNLDMIEQANLILKKCGGLPLAISTIGSFLATKPKTALEWRNLNKHISAELEMNPELGMINTVLTSSYDGLPYHSKSPFLYLSIFSEAHNIRWTRLVRRWIAEGYAKERRNKTAEEIGSSYIIDLINRSMVLPSKETAHRAGRVGFLQVHDLIREVGISKSTEENLVSTLEEGCNLNTQGKVRHLAVSSSWTRDKNAFESALDLSHLRSLTVFGDWKSFFLSDKMRVLRVLDLEDTKGLKNHHLHQIVKLFHLKYLSLRRCAGILRLPNSLGNLRHLQTLDIRDTEVIKLPKTIIKLRKLQYLRVGVMPRHDSQRGKPTIIQDNLRHFNFNWLGCLNCENDPFFDLGPYFCYFTCCSPCGIASLLLCLGQLLLLMTVVPILLIGQSAWVLMQHGFYGLLLSFMGLQADGVKFPGGIRELKDLHTMGVVNISRRNAIVEDLQYLTQLRKLRVTGLNKKNCKKLFSAIAQHKCLDSLLVQADGKPGLYGCLDGVSLPPKNLQSLKLYGNLVYLPGWIEGLRNLVKLELRNSRILEAHAAIEVLGKLPNLSILRLRSDPFGCELVHLNFHQEAFPRLVVLEVEDIDRLELVEFKQGATPKLELLQLRGLDRLDGLSGLPSLSSLKEVLLQGYLRYGFADDLRAQLAKNPNRPILKTGTVI